MTYLLKKIGLAAVLALAAGTSDASEPNASEPHGISPRRASLNAVAPLVGAQNRPSPRSKLLAKEVLVTNVVAEPTGTLRVQVAPWGNVFVDGKRVLESSTQVDLVLGKGVHMLEVQNPFSTVYRKTVEVGEGHLEVRVHLKPQPATVLIESEETAQVRVNGIVIGEVIGGMPTLIEVPFGSWRGNENVELLLEGASFSRSYPMLLEAGRFHSLVVDLP